MEEEPGLFFLAVFAAYWRLGHKGQNRLMLVASLSATWGICRTPVGKAVYFTLAFEPGSPGGDGRAQTWGL